MVRAYERGLDAEDRAFIHGTTLFVLDKMLETGVLPPGRGSGLPGYLYFEPLPSRFPFQATRADVASTDQAALSSAKAHARGLAFDYAVLRTLGIAEFAPALHNAADRLSGEITLSRERFQEGVYAPLREAGLAFKNACGLLRMHADDSGVGLIFSRTLAERFRIEEAEQGDIGLRIYVPEGMPLEFLAGIEPFCDEAFQLLERWRVHVCNFG
jgi:hypothetical protein